MDAFLPNDGTHKPVDKRDNRNTGIDTWRIGALRSCGKWVFRESYWAGSNKRSSETWTPFSWTVLRNEKPEKIIEVGESREDKANKGCKQYSGHTFFTQMLIEMIAKYVFGVSWKEANLFAAFIKIHPPRVLQFSDAATLRRRGRGIRRTIFVRIRSTFRSSGRSGFLKTYEFVLSKAVSLVRIFSSRQYKITRFFATKTIAKIDRITSHTWQRKFSMYKL